MLEPQFQEILAQNDPLSSWRRKYWDRFRELGSLDFRGEAFQYVPLQHLVLPRPAEYNSDVTVDESLLKIVFIDGFFSPDHSLFPDDVVCLPLDLAMKSYGAFLQTRMIRTIREEKDPFAALNGAFLGRGAFLYVPPRKEFLKKIVVEHILTSPDMATPRLMIYLGKGAKVEIVERFCGKEIYFVNSCVDIVLDEGASLRMKTSHVEGKRGHLFRALRADLKKESRFILQLYSEGSEVARHSLRIQLLEEQAEALLQGVTALQNQAQNHIHAVVEHLAPSCRSRQHFKALLKDQTRSSFEGKIYVHPLAQKTESYQLSNNLLLSDQAIAFAKPNLEILADDVKASHGATVSQIDEESLFYLRSRGLSQEEAKRCLTESFLYELKECLDERTLPHF